MIIMRHQCVIQRMIGVAGLNQNFTGIATLFLASPTGTTGDLHQLGEQAFTGAEVL